METTDQRLPCVSHRQLQLQIRGNCHLVGEYKPTDQARAHLFRLTEKKLRNTSERSVDRRCIDLCQGQKCTLNQCSMVRVQLLPELEKQLLLSYIRVRAIPCGAGEVEGAWQLDHLQTIGHQLKQTERRTSRMEQLN